VVTRSELHDFLHQHRLAVISTINPTWPEAAVVGIAVTEDLDIIFDTLSTSRKYANLRADPRVALVIWHDAVTVQIEGVADLPDGADLDACKRVYFEAWPDGPEREKWPDIAYVRLRPRWIRFSDFGQTPARIEELRFQ
jgi:Pyridoxamine 5'-phosphate oxidase